jgi:hypothetical protein
VAPTPKNELPVVKETEEDNSSENKGALTNKSKNGDEFMNMFDGFTAKNPEYEEKLAKQDLHIKDLQDKIKSLSNNAVLDFDIPKLKDLVIVTFAENKKLLMKKGLTKTAEILQANLV